MLFLAAVGVASTAALAQEGWRTSDGRRAPNTESRKSQNGFAAWLIPTSDDWRKKWETPSTTSPQFTEIRTVARGQKIAVLTFFSNPLLVHGNADVTCDIDIVRPNGTAIHQEDAPCYRGPIRQDPRYVFLSSAVIDFVGEKDDPAGKWIVRITVTDNARHVTLPLSTSFVLK
jgi:hypothetical protein